VGSYFSVETYNGDTYLAIKVPAPVNPSVQDLMIITYSAPMTFTLIVSTLTFIEGGVI